MDSSDLKDSSLRARSSSRGRRRIQRDDEPRIEPVLIVTEYTTGTETDAAIQAAKQGVGHKVKVRARSIEKEGERYLVRLEGGHPWGLRLQGGFEFAQHIRIAQVNPSSSAYKQGVRVGDIVLDINGTSTQALELADALYLLHANKQLKLELIRDCVSTTNIPVLSDATEAEQNINNSTFNSTTAAQQASDVDSTAQFNPTYAQDPFTDMLAQRGQQQQQHSDESDFSKVTRYANAAQVTWTPKPNHQSRADTRENSANISTRKHSERAERGNTIESKPQPPWVPSTPLAGQQRQQQTRGQQNVQHQRQLNVQQHQNAQQPNTEQPLQHNVQQSHQHRAQQHMQQLDRQPQLQLNVQQHQNMQQQNIQQQSHQQEQQNMQQHDARQNQQHRPLQNVSHQQLKQQNLQQHDLQQQQQHMQRQKGFQQQAGGEKRSGMISPTPGSDSTDYGSEVNASGTKSPPPPPSFRNLAEFQKHYGSLIPDSVATSPSRKRLIKRDPLAHLATLEPDLPQSRDNKPEDSIQPGAKSTSCSNDYTRSGSNSTSISTDFTRSSTGEAQSITSVSDASVNPSRSASNGAGRTANGIKREEKRAEKREEKKSKGLAMFFSQREKHVDGEESDASLSQSENGGVADLKAIEKKIFPPDQKKVTFDESDYRKKEHVLEAPPVQKSSARIRLLDSEESDAESVHSGRRSRRSIAVKSIRKGPPGGERDSSVDSTCSSVFSRTDDEALGPLPRAPVSTSQDFLESLGGKNRTESRELASPALDPGSNLREIKVASKRSDGKHMDGVTEHKVVRASSVEDRSRDSSRDSSLVDQSSLSNPQVIPDGMSQSEWYKQVFKAIHKLDTDDEAVLSGIDDADPIPPRPLTPATTAATRGIKVTSDTEVDYETERKRDTQYNNAYWSPSAPSATGNKQVKPAAATVQLDSSAVGSSSHRVNQQSPHSSIRSIKLDLKQDTDKKKDLVNNEKKFRHSGRLPVQSWRTEEDKQLCDDSYWLRLAGLDNKEPVTATMILHPDGYKSDSEAMYGGERERGALSDVEGGSLTAPRKGWKPPGVRGLASQQQKQALGRARALYDFNAQHNNELTLREHDVMKLVSKVDENWFQAELRGRTGLVPCSYVQRIESGDPKELRPQQHNQPKPQQQQQQPKPQQREQLKPQQKSEGQNLKVTCESRVKPSANQISPSSTVERFLDESPYSTLDPADKYWYEGNLGSCKEIYPGGGRKSDGGLRVDTLSNNFQQDPLFSLPGFETSGSASPLSSILSTNAPLSPSYDTDADLDKLIYDALLAIEDAQQSGSRNKLAHLPTVPLKQAQRSTYSSSYKDPGIRPVSNETTYQPSLKTAKSNSVPSAKPVVNSYNSIASYPVRKPPSGEAFSPKQVASAAGLRSEMFSPKPGGGGLRSSVSPGRPQHDRYPQTHSERDLDDILLGPSITLPQDPWLLRSGAKSLSPPRRPEGGKGSVIKDLRVGGKKVGYDGASYELDTRKIAATRSGGVGGRGNTVGGRGNTIKFEEPWYQVLYDYTPQHDDELELKQGDLVYMLERCDDGWCVGHADRTKKLGTFPGNYVTQLR